MKRLLKTGQFSYSKTTEETKEDYIRKSSPIAAFLMDCVETDSDAFIEKKMLYATFTEYCRNLKLPAVTQETFFKNLPKYTAVADYKPNIKGTRFYAFKGIRFSMNRSSWSTQSRVFYTLIEKSELFKNNGFKVTVLPDSNFIKVENTLDSLDQIDQIDQTNPESHKLASSQRSLQEKLEEIKAWLVANKNSEGLVDSGALALKCAELGLDVQKTVKILLDDSQIFEVPAIGKWGVK
ncbi:hypothetical protein G4O51_13465 [Candidatus Bathyarchaeota archaeon A05DMB-2]|jgi:phage/plasmid-associated DNA primase|nr:hypothetical protein [Candidatus Bathyarchaeota archaeon A05DMB-2]